MTGRTEQTLGARLRVTVHVSPLRFRLLRLRERYPSAGASCLEDWLVDVANARGARIVRRRERPDPEFTGPPAGELSDEDLVVAICALQCRDRPQMLRLAAQLVSREAVDATRLAAVARRERVGIVLGELARQAVKVDSSHRLWQALLQIFGNERPPREPILHWTRMAEAVPEHGRVNAVSWRLVA